MEILAAYRNQHPSNLAHHPTLLLHYQKPTHMELALWKLYIKHTLIQEGAGKNVHMKDSDPVCRGAEEEKHDGLLKGIIYVIYTESTTGTPDTRSGPQVFAGFTGQGTIGLFYESNHIGYVKRSGILLANRAIRLNILKCGYRYSPCLAEIFLTFAIFLISFVQGNKLQDVIYSIFMPQTHQTCYATIYYIQDFS
ncbi:hypothetical protein ACJX0J_015597 [Zea mays]